MKLIYLIPRVFLAWTFFNFMAHFVLIRYRTFWTLFKLFFFLILSQVHISILFLQKYHIKFSAKKYFSRKRENQVPKMVAFYHILLWRYKFNIQAPIFFCGNNFSNNLQPKRNCQYFIICTSICETSFLNSYKKKFSALQKRFQEVSSLPSGKNVFFTM